MVDGWQWDDSLFKGAAAYYERGRLPYAPGYADTLAKALNLDGSGRLLDVGCGPGIVLLALAPFFAEAVGAYPDADMLAEAGQVIERTADDVVAWVFSMSHSAPHLFGDKVADFEHDLRMLLQKASPDNRFAESLPASEIRTWRKPRGA